MKRKLILLLALLILPLFVITFKLKAQQNAAGLRVTPVSFDLAIDKGLTSTGVIHLENFTKDKLDIAVNLKNFTAQGEQGEVVLSSDDSQYSLAKWISISPTRVTLNPGEKRDFNFKIIVPSNAEPGGHFGSIVFSTVPSKTLNSTGAVVSQSVGALFLVKVPGPVNENAILESFKAGKSFYDQGPVDFVIRVKNNSTVHVKPIGVITIKNDITGQKYVVGVDGKNVLPNAIRQIPVEWNHKFLLGKYTATANLNYGSKSNPIASSTEFIGFPVKFGIIIAGIFIAIIVFRKRLWKALRIILKGK
jgi:hypothetical protein